MQPSHSDLQSGAICLCTFYYYDMITWSDFLINTLFEMRIYQRIILSWSNPFYHNLGTSQNDQKQLYRHFLSLWYTRWNWIEQTPSITGLGLLWVIRNNCVEDVVVFMKSSGVEKSCPVISLLDYKHSLPTSSYS